MESQRPARGDVPVLPPPSGHAPHRLGMGMQPPTVNAVARFLPGVAL